LAAEKLMLRLALLLLVLLWPGIASAERVFVRSAKGEVGHAWLFGNAWQGKVACWLAIPRHVTLDATGALAPFTYTDAEGRSAETGLPVAVSEIEAAVEAAGGVTDLAFARPSNDATGCTSRLGLPEYAYAGLMETVAEMQVWSMSPRSYGPFWVRLNRAQAAADGGLLRLAPVDPEIGRNYLIQGISGSVATAQRAGEVLPFAMILEVDDKTGQARAIRFDRIRKAFDLVEASAKRTALAEQIAIDGVPFVVDSFAGMTRAGGPSALTTDEACWSVLPEGGKRSIDVLLDLGETAERTIGLTLASGACADAGQRFIVEQRAPGASSWTPAADCQTVARLEASPACHLDLRAPRQFRLRIIASGEVGLDRLRFY
jgi:hypothetical protein